MKVDGLKRERDISGRNLSKQKIRLNAEEVLERKLGFDLFTEGDKRLGWLLTFAPVSKFLLALFICSNFHQNLLIFVAVIHSSSHLKLLSKNK